MRKKGYLIGILMLQILLSSCAKDKLKESNEKPLQMPETEKGENFRDTTECLKNVKNTEMIYETEEAIEEKKEMLNFVDVFGEEYQVEILPEVEKHSYQLEAFHHNGDLLSYEGDERYNYRLGIDVSHHQGTIDCKMVKSSGIDFAFLRIGYRGYGETGNVCLDQQFFYNIENAQKVGIDVGVYFFSQAINEEEAKEEAEFVIKNLEGYELQLPVVYDPESILDAEARTDSVTGEQFTKNTIVFCDLIKEAGYEPMIYSNMLWEAYQYDLTQLTHLPIWYADYEAEPQTPYYFTFWQYTNEGSVNGVAGIVDMDIELIPTEKN